MMSWFISPWEAARLSLEAQRQVALLFFSLCFPPRTTTPRSSIRSHKPRRNSPGGRLLGGSTHTSAIEENCSTKNCSGSQSDASDEEGYNSQDKKQEAPTEKGQATELRCRHDS
jgi:hypothetical protein